MFLSESAYHLPVAVKQVTVLMYNKEQENKMAFESTKSYYSISEVTKIASVPAYLLRYWENFFTELNPSRDTRGNRRYTNRDIAMVLHIKELVYEKGYKLGKASELIKGKPRDTEEDHKTAEILRLQKQMGNDKNRFHTIEERRTLLLREIKLEIEEMLQMLG